MVGKLAKEGEPTVLMHGGGIDSSVLEPVVRRAVGDEAFVMGEWRAERVHESRAATTAAVYRIAGSGSVKRPSTDWSLFLKVIQPNGGSEDPTNYRYWRREPLILASGLLDRPSAGLRAPRCYAVEERGGAIWLWMEAVPDTVSRPWSLQRYALAARHLGAFNGAYLSEHAMSGFPWLTRNLLRDYSGTGSEADLDKVRVAAGEPLFQRAWPGDVLDHVQRLWKRREELLAAVARLPRTLCHGDPNDQNMLAHGEETTAVDWAFAGIGAVGEDLAVLSRSSLPPGASLAAMDAAIFPAYVTGLREAGWRGDVRMVRLGYAAAAALRHALNTFPIALIHNAALRERFERSFAVPFERILDRFAAFREFALELSNEAFALIDALP